MRYLILLLQSVFAFHRQQWGHFPVICPTGERIQVPDGTYSLDSYILHNCPFNYTCNGNSLKQVYRFEVKSKLSLQRTYFRDGYCSAKMFRESMDKHFNNGFSITVGIPNKGTQNSTKKGSNNVVFTLYIRIFPYLSLDFGTNKAIIRQLLPYLEFELQSQMHIFIVCEVL